MKTRSETVSFRADQDLLNQIDAECAEFAISRGQWVRGVVQSHFHRQESAITKEDVEILFQRLHDLTAMVDDIRPSVADSLFYVLTRVGEVPRDQAKAIRAKILEQGE